MSLLGILEPVGHYAPLLGVAGGILAAVSLARAIDDWPLRVFDKICSYVALATGFVMFFWAAGRFLR
ncbi:MAG: hypothetical protein JXP73_14610 [Deltaproteobacteria bacterium]|nr:hypothetical protein [Deltaproteobacteria bacterium]